MRPESSFCGPHQQLSNKEAELLALETFPMLGNLIDSRNRLSVSGHDEVLAVGSRTGVLET